MKEILSYLTFTGTRYSAQTEKCLLTLLYGNFPRAFWGLFINSTFFALVMWAVTDHVLLLSWYLMILFTLIARYLDVLSFRKNFDLYTQSAWYRRAASGVTATSLLWGWAVFFFFPESNIQYQLFVIVVIIGMSVGAVTSLVYDLRFSFFYLAALLLPLEYHLFRLDGTINLAIAAMVMLMAVVVLGNSVTYLNRVVIKNFESLTLYRRSKERFEESERKLRLIFEHTPVGIFYYSPDLKIIDCNSTFCAIFVRDKEQLVGMDINQLEHGSFLPTIRDTLTTFPQVREGFFHPDSSSKEAIWIKLQCAPIYDGSQQVVGGVGIIEDKTMEQAAREETEFMSLHDPLTGLANRQLLTERMREVLKEDRRRQSYTAILFLDIDHFKEVNDSHGHGVGDQLLIATGERLQALLRETDTLCRLGGDEFVVMLPRLSRVQDDVMVSAHHVAEKIHKSLSGSFELDDAVLFVTVSIGIVLSGDGLYDEAELLRRADIAMYQAKEEGRNDTRFYDAVLDEHARAFFLMQESLRNALVRNEFELFFQPVVKMASNKTCAAEVLLRWKNGTEEPIAPAEFIPVAEKAGLLKDIGKWVIAETCKQIRDWVDRDIFTLDYVSVNISTKQFHDPELCEYIVEVLEDYHIDPAWLKFEITENALIDNFTRTQAIIRELKSKGIEFIIDDFGTGYSLLAHLKDLPFSKLKIDRVFVRDLLTNKGDEAVVRAIIEIANQFDCLVVAEGVEEEAQRVKLLEANKNIYYQGFLYSKAVDAKSFESFLGVKGDCRDS